MLADAFLAVAAATERAQHPPPPGMIALSCNEIALFAALVIRPVGDAPVGLVIVATTTSGPRPDLPLPTASHPAAVNIELRRMLIVGA